MLAHTDLKQIAKVAEEMVEGLPKIWYNKDNRMMNANIHTDLFDSHNTTSYNENKYCFIIVDDYTRYTCPFKMSSNIEM